MPQKKPAVIFLLLFLAVVTCGDFAWGQTIRLNVGYSAASADQLPAWVAKETGIFAKNGLDVQLIFFTGGTTAILALVSGDVPITQVSGPGLVNSVFAGSDAVFVAAGIISLNYVLMGKPGIKSAEQLKGGTGDQSIRFGDGYYRAICFEKGRYDAGKGCDARTSRERPRAFERGVDRQGHRCRDQSAVQFYRGKEGIGGHRGCRANGLGVSTYGRCNNP